MFSIYEYYHTDNAYKAAEINSDMCSYLKRYVRGHHLPLLRKILKDYKGLVSYCTSFISAVVLSKFSSEILTQNGN
jgi:hypothetical protein